MFRKSSPAFLLLGKHPDPGVQCAQQGVELAFYLVKSSFQDAHRVTNTEDIAFRKRRGKIVFDIAYAYSA